MILLNRRVIIILLSSLFVFNPSILSFAGWANKASMIIEDNIDHISFSADGKKILFDRQKGSGPQMINVYNLETHELAYYQSPPDETWKMARYSPDGKHIVFSIGTPHIETIDYPGAESRFKKRQIAIMEPDGKNLREFGDPKRGGDYPTFSHSGKTVIYEKGSVTRVNGRIISSLTGGDFYELDINTGKETRLTWFYIFTLLSPPFEFPDGKTLVFSEFGTNRNSSEFIQNDNSYLVKKGDKKLPYPFFVPDNRYSFLISKTLNTRGPLVSKDGKHVYFWTNAQKPDRIHGEGDQIFEYSKEGKHRRLTYLPVSTIYSDDLSPDGQYLAVIFDPLSKGPVTKKIAICNIITGSYKEINLPDKPSRIINQNQK